MRVQRSSGCLHPRGGIAIFEKRRKSRPGLLRTGKPRHPTNAVVTSWLVTAPGKTQSSVNRRFTLWNSAARTSLRLDSTGQAQTDTDDFWHGSRRRRNTQISRQTGQFDYARMNRWIAQKFNGELLRHKNKLACSCHQVLPISPDISGPHAVRGLLCDLPLKRTDHIRVIRGFGEAKPVSKKLTDLSILTTDHSP